MSMTPNFVLSQSNLRRSYLVDIQRQIRNCLNFPRLQFCKNLCAVKIQYPFILPFEKSSPDLPRSSPVSSQRAATSGELTHHPSIPSGLPSVALPNQDCLSPNQNLWAATAKWMGVKTPPKWCQCQTAIATVPSTTSQHIGSMGKKHKLLFTDAYSSREQSGKHARANTVSAAANAVCRLAPPHSHSHSHSHSPIPAPIMGTHLRAHNYFLQFLVGFTYIFIVNQGLFNKRS